MTETVVTILSTLTLVADIVLVVFLLVWSISRLMKKNIFNHLFNKINPLLNKYGLIILFIIPLAAAAGSLYFSEIAGWTPCRLCWYQRILMYPQAILLATALYKKSRVIIPYLIPLSLIGVAISAFQYYEQIRATFAPLDPLTPCSLDGTSCSVKYFFHFGYITIPMMSLTAFLLILVLSWLILRRRESWFS